MKQEEADTYGDGVGDVEWIDDVVVSVTNLTDKAASRTSLTLHDVTSAERHDATQLRQV